MDNSEVQVLGYFLSKREWSIRLPTLVSAQNWNSPPYGPLRFVPQGHLPWMWLSKSTDRAAVISMWHTEKRDPSWVGYKRRQLSTGESPPLGPPPWSLCVPQGKWSEQFMSPDLVPPSIAQQLSATSLLFVSLLSPLFLHPRPILEVAESAVDRVSLSHSAFDKHYPSAQTAEKAWTVSYHPGTAASFTWNSSINAGSARVSPASPSVCLSDNTLFTLVRSYRRIDHKCRLSFSPE